MDLATGRPYRCHFGSKRDQNGAKATSYHKVKIERSLQPELDPEELGGTRSVNLGALWWGSRGTSFWECSVAAFRASRSYGILRLHFGALMQYFSDVESSG